MTQFLLDWAIRSTVLLTMGLVGAALLRRRPAAWRHSVLAAALVCAALLPVLRPVAPSWRLPVSVVGLQAATSPVPEDRTSETKSPLRYVTPAGSQASGIDSDNGREVAGEMPAVRFASSASSRLIDRAPATAFRGSRSGSRLPTVGAEGSKRDDGRAQGDPRLGCGTPPASGRGRLALQGDLGPIMNDAASMRGTGPANVAPSGGPMPPPLPILPVLAVAVPALILLRRTASLLWIAAKARSGRRSARLDEAVASGRTRLALRRRTEARLLEAAACPTAMTWGHVRPMIAMPELAEEWPDERMAGVVLHELAHVKRGDWLIQQAAGIAAALLWFQPLAWLAYRKLRPAAECAADDLVLEAGLEPAAYASHLLAGVRARRDRRSPLTFAGVDTMSDSHFETRIKSIVSYNDRRGGRARPSALALLGVSLATALALASVAGARQAAARVPAPSFPNTLGVEQGGSGKAQSQLQAQRANRQREAEMRMEARRKQLEAKLQRNGILTSRQKKALVQLIEAQRAELAELRAEAARYKAERQARALSMSTDDKAARQAAEALRAAQAARSEEVLDAIREAQAGVEEAQAQLQKLGDAHAEQRHAVAEAMKALASVDSDAMQKEIRDALAQAANVRSSPDAQMSQAQVQQLREAIKELAAQMNGMQTEEVRAAVKQLMSQKDTARRQVEQALKQLQEARKQQQIQGTRQEEQGRAIAEAMRQLMLQKDLQKEITQAVEEALKAAFEAEKAKDQRNKK